MIARFLLPLAMVLTLGGLARQAEAEAYLRVLAQKTPIHSGPSGNYRTVFIAERGQVFQVLERGTRDYWFKVELEDGTSGWILGDVVYPFDVGPDEAGALTRMGRSGGRSSARLPSPTHTSGCRSRRASSIVRGSSSCGPRG